MTHSSAAEAAPTDDLTEVGRRFAVAITPAMDELIDPDDPADPIARQFLPDAQELVETQDELRDPIGDDAFSPVKGIVHRYPDRLLLTPIKICPVYCRFCFRRESVGKPEHALLSDAELDAALEYIRNNNQIWEVILSGGDPLVLSPRRMRRIIAALTDMDHVQVIRVHTRVPVVAPDRVSAPLISALTSTKAVYVVLHSNHPKEMTAAARSACARLANAGIPLLSQTVLLKGVNDNAQTLEELFRIFVANRIKPYYLHHADRARGTSHFRTSINTGRNIMRALRGRVSGLCQPTYVLDIPGGHGKVPLEPAWATLEDNDHYQVTDYRGNAHVYADNSTHDD